jgi:2-polyprenyl-3-methyl-5-hydroxy-6-metoxy-1,4-benzoquinol methylase
MEFKRVADIKRLQFILNTLKYNLPPRATVLDVGCGNGVISRSLGEVDYNVYGIDVSEKAIAKAKELNKFPNVSFDVISAEQLVAEGKKYDAIICSEVLEHLNRPEDLLITLYQSLTDTGVLIITVPNGKGPRELFVTRPVIWLKKKDNFIWHGLLRLKKLLGYKGTTVQSDASDLTHIHFFTKKSLDSLARLNNFKIIRFGKTNFIEDVFPFSLLSKRLVFLQKMDCAIAEILPYRFTGGFVTVWQKNIG